MKLTNKFRIRALARNYILTYLIVTLGASFIFVLIQENSDLLSRVISPEFVSLNIFESVLKVLVFTTPAFFILGLLHIWKVNSKEYLTVYRDFVEGPTESGSREVLSFSQIHYIGRDIFGRFSLKSNDFSIILPGDLTKLDVLELEKELKRGRLQNNL